MVAAAVALRRSRVVPAMAQEQPRTETFLNQPCQTHSRLPQIVAVFPTATHRLFQVGVQFRTVRDLHLGGVPLDAAAKSLGQPSAVEQLADLAESLLRKGTTQ